MVEAVAHVGVGREVEDRVAARERASETLAVEHVALDELDARPGARRGDELALPVREVVVDDDLDAVGDQPIGERAADEPGSAGDERLPHAAQSWKPAASASRSEHLHGLERERVEILAEQVELGEQVVRHRDDVAADRVGLDEVEHLARAGPDQLGRGATDAGSRATGS